MTDWCLEGRAPYVWLLVGTQRGSFLCVPGAATCPSLGGAAPHPPATMGRRWGASAIPLAEETVSLQQSRKSIHNHRKTGQAEPPRPARASSPAFWFARRLAAASPFKQPQVARVTPNCSPTPFGIHKESSTFKHWGGRAPQAREEAPQWGVEDSEGAGKKYSPRLPAPSALRAPAPPWLLVHYCMSGKPE